MLATAKELLSVIRETLVIAAVLFLLIFPSQVGQWLWAHGVQKIDVAGTTVSLEQFKTTRAALNAVQDVLTTVQQTPGSPPSAALPPSPAPAAPAAPPVAALSEPAAERAATQALSSLQTLADQLSTTLATQVQAISQQNPSILPHTGWLYLGTLNTQKSAWREGVSPTVRASWPVKPGDVLTLGSDTNLHKDSLPSDRPMAPIISVLPLGTKVRIEALDIARPVPPGDHFAPGYRAWAQVDVVD